MSWLLTSVLFIGFVGVTAWVSRRSPRRVPLRAELDSWEGEGGAVRDARETAIQPKVDERSPASSGDLLT
jgi:hypothetical protein